jgi:MFS family permease
MFESIQLKGLESNIWKLYIFKMLYGFFLSVPIIVLFWQENGLSMFEVMVLQGLFAVAVILLEVPSGYFADRYGRRNTLMTASVFATLGITAYSFGYGFIDFLIGETLWAVGVSLVSGADSAMFYDTLIELDQESTYKEKWGKASSYYMFSAAIAAVAGGLIADINLRWALYAQIPIFAAMIPIAYSLKEPDHHRDVSGKEKKNMKAVVTEVFQRPKLRNLILYGAFIYAALKIAFWFYQPYFKLSGLDVAVFGVIFASFNIVSALSSKYAHSIEEYLGKTVSLVMLMVMVVTSLSLMSSFVLSFSFVFIGLQQVVRGFSKPVISDYVNKIVDSETRSTILSTYSLLGRAFQALSMPLFGLVADFYTIPQTLSLLAFTVFAVGAVFIGLLYSESVIGF